MTTRPGTGVLQRMPLHGHLPTEVHTIYRNDGEVVRLTSHDRTLVFEGETFLPAVVAAASADRRQAGLRAGEQEVYGQVDGSIIVVADLLTYAYRGARVESALLDFARPWLVIARSTRWIRNVTRAGDRWAALLEGRTAKLFRNKAFPFNGTWSRVCGFELGFDPGPDVAGCKKDISPWARICQVAAVVDPRSTVQFTTAHIPATNPVGGAALPDQFYREGSVEWLYQTGTTPTAWTSQGASALQDTTQSWTVDEWVGYACIVIDSTGVPREAVDIIANTSNTLTFASAIPAYTPIGTYVIAARSILYGQRSPISSHLQTNREFEFLIPASRDVVVGYWAKVRPGCDGLITTCVNKYDNGINHGGDPYAPSAQEIVEPPDDPNN